MPATPTRTLAAIPHDCAACGSGDTCHHRNDVSLLCVELMYHFRFAAVCSVSLLASPCVWAPWCCPSLRLRVFANSFSLSRFDLQLLHQA
eukprot:m.13113 g.13113  ORF g.13113 m.13113 type:complete len:90 (+) comp18942_c0_seq2:156-425(+)